jgi:hypothetical protein
MPRTVKGPLTLENAGAICLAFNGTIKILIDALARAHGNTPGPWLDELEAHCIRDAKGTVTERIPIDVEFAALKFGVDAVRIHFDGLRDRLKPGAAA